MIVRFSMILVIFYNLITITAHAQYQIRTDESVKFERDYRHQEALINRVDSIKVFINNDTSVVAADWLIGKSVIATYNLDDLEEIEHSVNDMLIATLTRKYGSSLQSMSEEDKMDAYSSEFQILLNNSASLRESLSKLESASASHLLMYAYQIKALPAVVINDDTILYGYSNVNKALDKYFSVENINEN